VKYSDSKVDTNPYRSPIDAGATARKPADLQYRVPLRNTCRVLSILCTLGLVVACIPMFVAPSGIAGGKPDSYYWIVWNVLLVPFLGATGFGLMSFGLHKRNQLIVKAGFALFFAGFVTLLYNAFAN